ncbi:hypothetical protein MKX75_11535 [Paenibacillus sp. FSL R5-0341]|uniref:hypothetical protein n=1 Tax=Paenibacillus sp. FSL R5-0341 TaxID=2921636 RepID=UPI0030D3F28E
MIIQKWEVEFKQVRDYKITLDFIEDIELETNHPLLLEYLEPTTELYFKGVSNEVFKVIGELLIEHQKVTDKWIEFQHFMNGSLEWLLNQQQGLLAKGPETIIKTYKEVLERNHLNPNILQLKSDHEELKVAILGKSFVICKDLGFKKIL